MPDRNSATSINPENYIDPVVEEATIAMRTDPKSLAQLSSSGDAARTKRAEKPKVNLDKAIQRVLLEEETRSGENQHRRSRPSRGKMKYLIDAMPVEILLSCGSRGLLGVAISMLIENFP